MPLGFLEKLPPLPDGTPFCAPGVILMSDSRYSDADSGALYTDNGAKVWHLGHRVAAAFAGNVDLAERGFSAIKRRLDALDELTFQGIAEAAREGFTTAVTSDRRKGKNDRVECIVTTVATTGQVCVIGLTSADDFAPRSMKNAWAGDPTAMSTFIEFLREAVPANVDQVPDRFGYSPNVEWFEIRAAAAMNLAVEVGGHETVGGGIQLVTITAAKCGVKTRPGPSDPTLPSRVKVFTVGPDQVRSLTRRDRDRKDYESPLASVADFELYDEAS